MKRSTRALLEHIVDYAGLFPPASLSLKDAAATFAAHRRSAQGWMLARFVCPAARLCDLREYVESMVPQDDAPLAISLLGRGGDDSQAFLAGLADDISAAQTFVAQCGGRARIEVIETRWPAGFVQVGDAAARVAGLTPFFEVSLAGNWREDFAGVAQGLAAHNAGRAANTACRSAGIKLRCGGVEAAAFPSVEQVAWAIVRCRDAHVPLKFTAGLHHPLRHYNAGVGAHMHGFINVFGAGVLAATRRLSLDEVEAILKDEDPSHFTFTDESFGWRDVQASVADIADARRQCVVSFGSCSMDEPVRDLKGLGLL